MNSRPNDCDKDTADLLRTVYRGVSKHGVEKVSQKIKDLDIESFNGNYQEVRDFIIDRACILFRVTRDDIIGKDKRGQATVARKVVVTVIKKHFQISDESLASFFDGRSRQVVYNIMKEFEQMDRNDKLDYRNFFNYYDSIDAQATQYIKDLKST
jgi:chromosomal replication initiation ATPase DnaA